MGVTPVTVKVDSNPGPPVVLPAQVPHDYTPRRSGGWVLGSRVPAVQGGHGGRVVTLSPPTSEAGFRFPARPQVGKLVVACRWSAVYSTDP